MDITTDIFSKPHSSPHALVNCLLTLQSSVAALPIALAFRAHIQLSRKIELAAIFGLGLVTTAFAATRFAVDPPQGKPYGALWIVVWSIVELSVAVMVSSVIVLRGLARQHRRRTEASKGSLDFQCRGEQSLPTTKRNTVREMVGKWGARKSGVGEPQGDSVELLSRPKEAVMSSPGGNRRSKYLSGVTEASTKMDEYGVPMF